MADVSPDGTRVAVVRAALPLIGQYDSLTTARIAQAAGVDEAVLLREFDGKDAILHACIAHLQTVMATAVDYDEVLREIAAIPVDQPLATRLAEVIGTLERYNDRVFASIEAVLQPPGPMTVDTSPADAPGTRSISRDDLRAITRRPQVLRAVVELLTPDRNHLRLPADTLADAFLRMYVSAVRISHPVRPQLSAEQLVDLFLHGALTGTDAPP